MVSTQSTLFEKPEMNNHIAEAYIGVYSTVWDFPTQNYGDKPYSNNKYNRVTPALDVAKELNRKVIRKEDSFHWRSKYK